jgi:hypothetical protein
MIPKFDVYDLEASHIMSVFALQGPTRRAQDTAAQMLRDFVATIEKDKAHASVREIR